MGTMGTFSTVDKKTAPFFGFLKTGEVVDPSGKIPRISPFFKTLFAFLIVDGAMFSLSIGIKPYK